MYKRLIRIIDKNRDLLHCTKLDSEQASAEYSTRFIFSVLYILFVKLH